MGEIVRFDRRLLAVMQFVVDRQKAMWNKLGEAYDWAFERQREMGLVAEPVRMTFTGGDYVDDGDGFIMSIFYDKTTGKVLLRRDWIDQMGVSYNIVTNIDEIAKEAPNALRHMFLNGVTLMENWEG